MSTYKASHLSYDLERIVGLFKDDYIQLREVERILRKQLDGVQARLEEMLDDSKAS